MTQTEKAAAAAQADTSTQAVEPTQSSSPVIPTQHPHRDSGIMWVKSVVTRPSHTLFKGWDKVNGRLVELMSYKDNPDFALSGLKAGDHIGYATARWEAREVTAPDQHGVMQTTHKPGGSRQEGIPLDQM